MDEWNTRLDGGRDEPGASGTDAGGMGTGTDFREDVRGAIEQVDPALHPNIEDEEPPETREQTGHVEGPA